MQEDSTENVSPFLERTVLGRHLFLAAPVPRFVCGPGRRVERISGSISATSDSERGDGGQSLQPNEQGFCVDHIGDDGPATSAPTSERFN